MSTLFSSISLRIVKSKEYCFNVHELVIKIMKDGPTSRPNGHLHNLQQAIKIMSETNKSKFDV